MLPKIPYMMEKNKSAVVPIGTFNLSCKFNPGDIADSRGISARKHPYLTTKKGNVKQNTAGASALFVFNGQEVSVREGNLYIGDEQICQLSQSKNTRFTTINSRLVIYPDKIAVEKGDLGWTVSPLSADINIDQAVFSSNSIATTNARYKIASGQGCEIVGAQFKITESTYWAQNSKVLVYNTIGENTYSDRKAIGVFRECDVTPIGSKKNPKKAFIHFIDNRLEFMKDNTTMASNVSEFCRENGIVNGSKIYVKTDGDEISSEYVVASIYAGYIVVDGSPNFAGNNYYSSIFYKDNSVLEDYLGDSEGKTINIEYGGKREKCWLAREEEELVLYGKTVIQLSRQFVELSFATIGWDTFFDDPYVQALLNNTQTILITCPDNDNFPITFTRDEIARDCITAKENISENEIYVTPGKLTEGVVTIWGLYNDKPEEITDIKKGDTVVIVGTVNNDMAFTVDRIEGGTIYAQADIFNASEETEFRIIREIPNLDFICEKDNRLYGVNNAEKTIYVSALGDPTNMYAYEGVSTDSYAVAVGGEGDFTACCKFGESVLFFKEDKLYKLTGSYPAEFALYSYDVPGIARGSEKSCVVINEVLYYHGKGGIYAYTGGVPTLISENFGERIFSDAVGGSDGVSYYVSMSEGEKHYLLAYNTRLGLWVLEDNIGCVDLVRRANGLYYLDENGDVYAMNQDADVSWLEWFVQFVPFYETIEGKKIYSRLVFHLELPRGSYIKIEARVDGGVWQEAGIIVGRGQGVFPIRLPITRCDKFEIRLSGKGEFTMLDIMREYYVGSEA